MKSGCVYPGSFDPITNGHIDVIRRALALFGNVTVAILVNERKTGLFSPGERCLIAQKALAALENVQVETFDGLLVDFMKKAGSNVIVRGLRTAGDFEREWQAAQLNRMLEPAVETVFLPASPELGFVSSSAAKEIASFGGDMASMVPQSSFEALKAAFRDKF